MEANLINPLEANIEWEAFLAYAAKHILDTDFKPDLAPIIENENLVVNEHIDRLNEVMKSLHLTILFDLDSSVGFVPGSRASTIEALWGRKEGLLELERRGELDVTKALTAAVCRGHMRAVEWLLSFEITDEVIGKCLHLACQEMKNGPKNLDHWAEIQGVLQKKCSSVQCFKDTPNKRISQDKKLKKIVKVCLNKRPLYAHDYLLADSSMCISSPI